METAPFSEQEIQRLRSETRGTTGRIHFNNAGASLPPDVVVEAVVKYLNEEALHGGYEVEARYKEALENVYALIARLIGSGTDEVCVVENASTAWGIAFHGVDLHPGDVVITSEMEYVTNIIGFLNAREQHGIEVKVIPNDERNNFSLPALERAICPRTRLIAVTHIASTTGGMIPIAEIGQIARKHGVLYLVDACQTAGQVPIDVNEVGCDMLSATGRKFLRAPRGTGFLYVRKEVQDRLRLLFMDGHSIASISQEGFQARSDARRFELYEKNRGVMLGLGAAIDYALQVGVGRIWRRVEELAGSMRRQLRKVGGVVVHDQGEQLCGIVTFSVNGMDATAVKSALAERRINVSVGNAHSTLYFMDKHHLTSVVRASVHYYNTEEEIGALCESVASLYQTV
ncbi:MAG: aminotransferase class V-fold PLP-dependent enzyme [Bacteroidota bacterium]|nr:aminotransferase class V-fold PLP-dependent enzyme [Bacteroidota bacterium]